jgi:hypothetical protein
MLTDHVLIHHHWKQRYGTQFKHVSDGWKPGPIEDPEQVDTRRASVGLGTLAEYTCVIQVVYGRQTRNSEPCAKGGEIRLPMRASLQPFMCATWHLLSLACLHALRETINCEARRVLRGRAALRSPVSLQDDVISTSRFYIS